jgi:hypothetical protein
MLADKCSDPICAEIREHPRFNPQGHFAFGGNNGHREALALNESVAIDPTATLAVRCDNDFCAGFSPFQGIRPNR